MQAANGGVRERGGGAEEEHEACGGGTASSQQANKQRTEATNGITNINGNIVCIGLGGQPQPLLRVFYKGKVQCNHTDRRVHTNQRLHNVSGRELGRQPRGPKQCLCCKHVLQLKRHTKKQTNKQSKRRKRKRKEKKRKEKKRKRKQRLN